MNACFNCGDGLCFTLCYLLPCVLTDLSAVTKRRALRLARGLHIPSLRNCGSFCASPTHAQAPAPGCAFIRSGVTLRRAGLTCHTWFHVSTHITEPHGVGLGFSWLFIQWLSMWFLLNMRHALLIPSSSHAVTYHSSDLKKKKAQRLPRPMESEREDIPSIPTPSNGLSRLM
jgi:hypothetical protein